MGRRRRRAGQVVSPEVAPAPGARGRGLRSPATAEVQYTLEELEYLRALEAYQRTQRRPFPTAREYLAVAIALGYRRVAEPGPPPVFRRDGNGRGE